jgi:hypothetical protein
MFPWPFSRREPAPAIEPAAPEPAPVLSNLARFDTFTPTEVAALPKRLRREVIADRKRRVTAALVRVAAGEAREW